MTTNNIKLKLPEIASVISEIYHPFAMPLYIITILLFGDNYLNTPSVDITTKIIIVGITALTTLVIPLYCATLLTKYWQERKRTIFMLVFTLFYFITMFLLYNYLGKAISQKLFMTMAIITSIANIIDYYKGISMHLFGLGSLLTFLIMTHASGYANILHIILLSILITGLVFTCRLFLNKTTLLNGVVSMLLGFCLTALLLYI